ncbi:helix-turn-helix domain-containing protein [Maritalea porphyrae]|jgi:transcriptional regulator with XRE-family HTH domain|uniref:helix-turn-helix domain-containing protein n=1 Tax=Maritalea porphyrae TaxID=880732 RepID=UPI0022AF530B|nr:XRE family transcriptional regulator [Maritalea porphyrae]MCZ4272036.1 XRE family transcriptional regulator [Maritalea porphyrae]
MPLTSERKDLDVSQLGDSIRAKRKQADRTLESLAVAAGISIGYLSQVERGHATPSLGTLQRIAQALDVNLDYFIATPTAMDAVTRDQERPTFFVGSSSISYERIGADFRGGELSSFVLNIPPGYRSETVSHTGEEIVYVLEGTLMQVVGEEKMRLNAGDSLHFRSNVQHRWWNESETVVRLFWVGTSDMFKK